ncbi:MULTISPECIES: MFS transporter [unclassified Streptomyces]|uniref:MFS transporter n=1 Tax=unclassified Streptomyces TaxID=2593676 RepID=UPI00236508E5|nr:MULTISPECIES: MFS transporter [unclassified Streptomyces]MDF3140213.1 MFS transporter [Streptomyces sp. T21Q-yed]WDF38212.1 MFS transporter [Streptomyces sp. T12]
MAPPSRTAGRVSAQALLYGLGTGSYFTTNAVFFTKVVGLSAAEVGLGLTIAGIGAFFAAVPLGRAADRVGPKAAWAAASLAEAACYLAYPAVRGFSAYLVIVIALGVTNAAGTAGYGAYVLNLYPDKERIAAVAYNRSAVNAGFTIGAGLGGLALATGSETAIRMLPLFVGVVMLINSAVIYRLPKAVSPVQDPTQSERRERRKWGGALSNRPFLAISVLSGVVSTNQVILFVVIPLWLVEDTNAPRALLAGLLATNTLMTVALQTMTARGTDTLSGAIRATYRSAACFVASCVITAFTDGSVEWLTIALVWLAHIVLTGAELFQAAAGWGFTALLSDPARRGEYQGVQQVGHTIGNVWAPAAYTYLAMNWHMTGWLTIAAIVALAAVLTPSVAHAAERSLGTAVAGTASSNDRLCRES